MLPTLEINKRCTGCENCLLLCPENAVLSDGTTYSIDEWACTICFICLEACPEEAITLHG